LKKNQRGGVALSTFDRPLCDVQEQGVERNDMCHDSSCAFTTLDGDHSVRGRTAEPHVSCNLAVIGV
jgi:hypothetical protein